MSKRKWSERMERIKNSSAVKYMTVERMEELLKSDKRKYNKKVFEEYGFKAWIMRPNDLFWIYDNDWKLLGTATFKPKYANQEFSDWLAQSGILQPLIKEQGNDNFYIRPIRISKESINWEKIAKAVVIDTLYK